MQQLFLFVILAGTGWCVDSSSWEHIFQKANAAHNEGRHQAAAALYRSALQRHEETGASAAHLPALLNNLAAECQILHQFEEAESLYRKSIAAWRKYPAVENGIGRSIANLAGLYRTMTRYQEAAATYRDALSTIEKGIGTATLEYASTLSKAADLQRSLGNWEEALPMAERASRIAGEFFDDGDAAVIRIIQVLACVYSDLGRLEESEKAYERTRITMLQSGRGATADAGSALTGLGKVAALRGEFVKAEALYREASAIYEKSLGAAHPLYAVALNNVAQALRNQAKFDDAGEFYERALRVLESGTGAGSVEHAACLSNYGEFYHAQGKDGQAAVFFTRSVNFLEKQLGVGHREVALARIRLAEVKGAQRNYVEAVRLYRQALPNLTKSLGPADPRVTATDAAYHQLLKEASAYVVMVR